MRARLTHQLAELNTALSAMAGLTTRAISHATTALTRADLNSAEQVIADQETLTGRSRDVEGRAFALLARQAPVASDLRAVVTALHIAADLERMGALAVHIAQIARRHYPHCAVPDTTAGHLSTMGRIAQTMAATTSELLVSHDQARATGLDTDDDAMDEMHRQLLSLLTDEPWPHSMAAAIDTTLLARYYERFADHAVLIGRRILFETTGTPGLDKYQT